MSTPDSPDSPRGPGSPVSEDLLSIIVCPDCHGELELSEVPELTCRGCGLVYPVRDGIPVLLVDEARKPQR